MNTLTSELENRLLASGREHIKRYNTGIIRSSYPFAGTPIPQIRLLAKEYRGCARQTFEAFDPISFEGVLLKGFLLKYVSENFEKLFEMTLVYLGLADNWAHIDCFFAGFANGKKYAEGYNERFKRFVDDDNVFLRRAVAVFTMDFRLTEEHLDEALQTFSAIRPGEYYSDMAVAWGLATAFAKSFDRTLDYVSRHEFSPEIRKMTVRKCCDSFRLDADCKLAVKKVLS